MVTEPMSVIEADHAVTRLVRAFVGGSCRRASWEGGVSRETRCDYVDEPTCGLSGHRGRSSSWGSWRDRLERGRWSSDRSRRCLGHLVVRIGVVGLDLGKLRLLLPLGMLSARRVRSVAGSWRVESTLLARHHLVVGAAAPAARLARPLAGWWVVTVVASASRTSRRLHACSGHAEKGEKRAERV